MSLSLRGLFFAADKLLQVLERFFFIANPISGSGGANLVHSHVKKLARENGLEVNFAFTEGVGHAKILAEEAKKKDFKRVIAVGGDGTVNEVGSGLLFSDVSMGIIPVGSGNGLARHLGLFGNTKFALNRISSKRIRKIDAGSLNDRLFFCTSGLGFEAAVAHQFGLSSSRGLANYIRVIRRLLFSHQPENFKIISESKTWNLNAFSLTIANAGQYGNNAWIAPKASISDGMLDFVSLKKMPYQNLPLFLWKLMRKSLHSTPYYHAEKFRELKIERSHEGWVHVDGEPIWEGKLLHYKVLPAGLNIIF